MLDRCGCATYSLESVPFWTTGPSCDVNWADSWARFCRCIDTSIKVVAPFGLVQLPVIIEGVLFSATLRALGLLTVPPKANLPV